MRFTDFQIDDGFWPALDAANRDTGVFWYFWPEGDIPPYKDSFVAGIRMDPANQREERDLRTGTYFVIRHLLSREFGVSPLPRSWEFASGFRQAGDDFRSSYILCASVEARNSIRGKLAETLGG